MVFWSQLPFSHVCMACVCNLTEQNGRACALKPKDCHAALEFIFPLEI